MTSQPGRGGRLNSSPVGFFALVVLLIVAVAILGSAGVFFYGEYLVGARGELDQRLAAARVAIEPDTLSELMRVGRRLSVAQELLSKHISVSSFFEFLQLVTVRSVQFTNFRYSVDPRRGLLNVDMDGNAPDYATLVFQSDTFSQHSDVSGVTFFDLDLDTKGDVTFSLKLTLDPAKFLFKNNLQAISFGFPY